MTKWTCNLRKVFKLNLCYFYHHILFFKSLCSQPLCGHLVSREELFSSIFRDFRKWTYCCRSGIFLCVQTSILKNRQISLMARAAHAWQNIDFQKIPWTFYCFDLELGTFWHNMTCVQFFLQKSLHPTCQRCQRLHGHNVIIWSWVECGHFFIKQNKSSNLRSGMILEVKIQNFGSRALGMRRRNKVFIFKTFQGA